MTKIEQLLKRYNFIRKCWINSHSPEEEQEWYEKLLIVEKEINSFKARNNASDLGSSVMAKYIGLSEISGQKGKEIEITQEDNHA